MYVAAALVEHRHRATTSRYFREEELAAILEINYLKFLARAVAGRRLFGKLCDPGWAHGARFNQNRALRYSGKSAVSAQPDLARGMVVRQHADHDRRAPCGICLLYTSRCV